MVPLPKWWLVATTTAVLAAVTGCSATIGGSASGVGGAGAGSGGAGSGGAGSGGAGSGGAGSGGAGSGGAGASACGAESGFCITVDITGATTLKGTAQTLNLSTCADYAKGTSPDDGLKLPGLLGQKIGGKEISAVNEIREYTGPGTYEKDTLESVAGVVDISIDNTPYQPADDTTAQAVIKADGSGSLTFANLEEGEQGNPGSPKGVISGSFTWTCSD